MYWGKYVQHDNNRDGMGQFLKLTQNVTKRNARVASDGSARPARGADVSLRLDRHRPVQRLARSDRRRRVVAARENDVMEMTKRGVPGVWTYGFYDGWVPNYMFFIAHTHNSIGRFYEVQSYGPDPYPSTPGRRRRASEWFRPNPPLPSIKWGPRNNTNIQESALLFALNHVGKNKELYLENYWLKNKRAVEKGKNGPTYAWVIPGDAAPQGRRRRRGERAAVQGSRSRARRRVQGRRRRRQGRRLHRPRRPAVPHARRHVLSRAELRAAESVAVRRHRLDVPVHARRQDHCR
jgi:hypothetical protein